MPSQRRVTVVSHGPNCLDGLTCAVVAARYFAGRRFEPIFASNREIDAILAHYDPTHPEDEELWITDISWHEPATDVHLDSLVARGLDLFWIDHHKSAIDRRAEGYLRVRFTDYVLDDSYCASRLLYHYLCKRAAERKEPKPGLRALENLVMLADDIDRWVLEIDGSRELALAVRAMEQQDAYRALLSIDSNITYTPELKRALTRVKTELAETFRLADATRHVAALPERDLTVIAAECNDYAGEIADRWRSEYSRGIFVLYDRRSDAISLRRTPDCPVDLSKLAGNFGGGGHAAAAGCQIEASGPDRAQTIARKVVDALARDIDR
jgi:oligoribonuclease NrnB/cAMP/cGMP phosphodiesterase (DHH superfamily)